MCFDAIGHLLAGFDIGSLYIDGTDTKLLIAEQAFVMGCHIVLDEVRIAIDLADQVRLVASYIEVSVSYLAIIVRSYSIIALTNMDQDVHVLGQPLYCRVDNIDSRRDLAFA